MVEGSNSPRDELISLVLIPGADIPLDDGNGMILIPQVLEECPLLTNGYCKDMMFNGAMDSHRLWMTPAHASFLYALHRPWPPLME